MGAPKGNSKTLGWNQRKRQRSPGDLVVKPNLRATSRTNYARMSPEMQAHQHGSSSAKREVLPAISLTLLDFSALFLSAFLVLVCLFLRFSPGSRPAVLAKIQLSVVLNSDCALANSWGNFFKNWVSGPYPRPFNLESLPVDPGHCFPSLPPPPPATF